MDMVGQCPVLMNYFLIRVASENVVFLYFDRIFLMEGCFVVDAVGQCLVLMN